MGWSVGVREDRSTFGEGRSMLGWSVRTRGERERKRGLGSHWKGMEGKRKKKKEKWSVRVGESLFSFERGNSFLNNLYTHKLKWSLFFNT